jgi:steroid delta-isomerase-like uncharacterized protein
MDHKHEEMIAMVQEHVEAERVGDLDRTMETLAPHPIFDNYAFGIHREGTEATRKFYGDFFDHGLAGFQVEPLRMWANDEAVVREDFTNILDVTEFYGYSFPEPRTARFHVVTVFPFEDGKIKGERVYFDRATALEQLGIKIRYDIL